MIAVDTNLLVYAHRSSMVEHAAALAALDRLALRPEGRAVPWPCVHEFVAVFTRPVPGLRATPLGTALAAVEAWLSHPGCRVLGETPAHFDLWRALVERAGVVGGAVHDARIVAIGLGQVVTEFRTRDRDFSRYPDVRTRDPLVPRLHEPDAPAYGPTVTAPGGSPPAPGPTVRAGGSRPTRAVRASGPSRSASGAVPTRTRRSGGS